MLKVLKRIINKGKPEIEKDLNSSFDSKTYWVDRYNKGGNSGAGSYNNLAGFKAEILNDFVQVEGIKRVIEIGCGDGNQLQFFNFPEYIGYDISKTVLKRCKSLYKKDKSKRFFHIKDIGSDLAELVISLDVVYHLVEDSTFHNYMTQLFSLSTKYVVIYSCNTDNLGFKFNSHVRPRKFTDWVKKNRLDFELFKVIKNEFPYNQEDVAHTSFSDFYFFRLKQFNEDK